MYRLRLHVAVSFLGLAGLLGCTDTLIDQTSLPPVTAATSDIDSFAIAVLDGLQARSIAESREYCGLISETQDGGLATSRIARGTEASCDFRSSFAPAIASFHTHGSYSPFYDNEVPSVDDVEGDFGAGIDGYVATPAGRVWHIDFESGVIRQLCGPGCITADPDNDPRNAAPVPPSLTLPALRARLG